MSELRRRVEEDVKAAMKGQRALERDTLRMVLAAMQKAEIDGGKALDDGQELEVVSKGVKTRQESVEQFDQAGRKDLADRERAEIALLERYLPRRLDEAATRDLLVKLAAEAGIAAKADLGRLMKLVMSRHKAEVDGKLVQRIAAEILA